MTEDTKAASLPQAMRRAAYRRLHALPFESWFGRRASRRLLVVAYGAMLGALPIIGWVSGRTWVGLLLLIPYAIGSVMLAGASQFLFDRPLARLDERQRHMRQTVFASPYPTGAAVGLAAGLGVAWSLQADNDALMLGWLLLILGFVFGLPSMVLAWRMPDVVEDGE